MPRLREAFTVRLSQPFEVTKGARGYDGYQFWLPETDDLAGLFWQLKYDLLSILGLRWMIELVHNLASQDGWRRVVSLWQTEDMTI